MANKSFVNGRCDSQCFRRRRFDGKNTELVQQRTAFKDMLIHDIDNQLFADLYSQTIAYGLFVARYHDPTLPTFDRDRSRQSYPEI